MAENKNIPETEDISSRLRAATGSIDAAYADVKAREAERTKGVDEGPAASTAESEKQRLERERRAAMLAAQRQAELEYAEEYRRKLQRDKKRAESAEREAREAREAEARLVRSREIAEKLEADRRDAEARADRSKALLEKIVAAREERAAVEVTEEVVPPTAPNVTVKKAADVVEKDVAEVVKEVPVKSEEKVDVTLKPVADETVAEATAVTKKLDENTVAETISESTKKPAAETVKEEIVKTAVDSEKTASDEIEKMIVDVGPETEKILVNITDDRILLNISAEGAIIESGPAEPVRIEEVSPSDVLEREGTALSVKNNITVATDDNEETAEKEEILDAEGPGYDDPITSKYPEVAKIKAAGRAVSTNSSFRKYISDSKNTIKRFNKQIAAFENALLIDNISLDSVASTIIEMLGIVGAVVEIRCDNLRIVSKFGQRRYIPEIKKALCADIERYNVKASEFATRAGERLTRISPLLADRIADGTGAEVIPVFSYTDKYIEIWESESAASESAFSITLPLGKEESAIPSVIPESVKTAEHIYKLVPVHPQVTAAELLSGENVTNKSSYNDYLKSARRAEGVISKEISKLRSKIERAEREAESLGKKLDKRRSVFDKMLESMDHSATAVGGHDRGLEALEREREKCEDIEKKIELNRTYIENESKNAEIIVGCLALEREKLLIAINTLRAAKATSVNKIILKAKNDLISEMARYNRLIEECAKYIKVEFTPVTASIAEDISEGSANICVPQIALLSELVETVGEESRVIGGRMAKKAPVGYTITINGGGTQTTNKSGTRTPIKTTHGHFFMGGVAPGNVMGASLNESEIALAAAMAVPIASANTGDTADQSLVAGAAIATAAAISAKKEVSSPVVEELKPQASSAPSKAKTTYFDEPDVTDTPVASEIPASVVKNEKAEPDTVVVPVTEVKDTPTVEQNEAVGASPKAPVLQETATDPVVEPAAEVVESVPAAEVESVVEAEPIITEEAPIAPAFPRRARKTVVDETGAESVVEEPRPEKLIDDETSDGISEPIIYEDKPSEIPDESPVIPENKEIPEPVAAPEEIDPKKKKKIRLRQLPPPEKSETAAVEELRPVTLDGPVYPGNTINKEYIDEDDFDPKDSTKIPSVVEVDDNAEDVESDVLIKPTKSGLKKHLSYVNKKVKKAMKERSRLVSQKKKTDGVAAKARVLISILGVQKNIVDWYCNAETSCCDLGDTKRAKKIAGVLLSELKKYNKFVKEYEKLTGDRLTYASLDIPALILDGEDYPIIPKVKIREFDAPEEGVVYGDGVTENADFISDLSEDVIMTEKDLGKRLAATAKEISKLRAELEAKVKEKHTAWGIDKTLLTVACFAIQKKIVDALAANLRSACQVSSVKKIQSIKKELIAEIKQYNRLVSEYKSISGNDLTRASENIAQDIIAGNLYVPLPRIGCIYANDEDDVNSEIRAMSRNSYGVEDDSYGIGGVTFRTKVTSQANKDLSLITKRADYHISMLESERDILDYRFGKEPRDVKREKREIGKRISSIRAAHKTALSYENSDNRRYYAVVTANPYTMELKNKRADRARVAALRSKIIELLNERDIVNGKLIALYTGAEGVVGFSSVNQEWRRIKNKAALKAKKKQKSLANTVKSLPITLSEKTKVYSLMNEKVDALSTLALLEYRLRKEKMHKEDKICAKRDIKAQKARIKEIDKKINELMKSINERIDDVQATSSWYVAFLVLLAVVAAGLAAYFYYIGPYFASLFS